MSFGWWSFKQYWRSLLDEQFCLRFLIKSLCKIGRMIELKMSFQSGLVSVWAPGRPPPLCRRLTHTRHVVVEVSKPSRSWCTAMLRHAIKNATPPTISLLPSLSAAALRAASSHVDRQQLRGGKAKQLLSLPRALPHHFNVKPCRSPLFRLPVAAVKPCRADKIHLHQSTTIQFLLLIVLSAPCTPTRPACTTSIH